MSDHNEDYVPKKYGKREALEDLDSIDSMGSFLPSSILKKAEEKKEEKKEVEDNYSDGDWMATLSSLRTEKKRKKSDLSEIFGNKKKKKKNKKKKGEPKDYGEDFEKEINLLQSLLHDQSKLSDSLQARYDQLTAQKTAARGIGKFTTDLVETLTDSRKECRDIISAIASIKKNVADLNMKEREKFRDKLLDDNGDLSNFASSYLNKILSIDRGDTSGGDIDIDELDDINDAFDDLNYNLKNSEDYVGRSEEAEKYMKYENKKVKTKVFYDRETGKRSFFAEDEDGNIIDDYPLPDEDSLSSLRINESTGVATDDYGQKFEVVEV